MSFTKVNLVTTNDGYDIWKCGDCGKQTKTRMGPPYRCESAKCKKLKHLWKSKTIFGCWGKPKEQEMLRPWCDSELMIVPRKGHPNSKYWNLEGDDGRVLKACPRGCSEDGACRLHRRTRWPGMKATEWIK